MPRNCPPPKTVGPQDIPLQVGIFTRVQTAMAAEIEQHLRPIGSHWDDWLKRTLSDSDKQVAEWLQTWPHAQLLGADLPYLEQVWSVMPPALRGWHRIHNQELAAMLDRS